MIELIDELKTDVKEERLVILFKKAIPYVTFLTIIIILVMAINLWLQDKADRYNQENGDMFLKAISLEHSKESPVTKESVEFLKGANSNIAELAKLYNLKYLKDANATIKQLEELADHKSISLITKHYAMLAWAHYNMDKNLSDVDAKKMDHYTKTISLADTPFYGSGSIARALWLSKNKENTQALQLLQLVTQSDSVTEFDKMSAQAISNNLK